jgi:hypothetical protein
MELSTICLDEDADAATSGSSGSRENPVNKDFGEYDEDSAFDDDFEDGEDEYADDADWGKNTDDAGEYADDPDDDAGEYADDDDMG